MADMNYDHYCNYDMPTGMSRVENGHTYYEYQCACGDTCWR